METTNRIQRQAAKALANLGVNSENKATIAEKGGIKPLIRLTIESPDSVKVESVAALANLAVNDDNEVAIGDLGGLPPILDCARSRNSELVSQACRAA